MESIIGDWLEGCIGNLRESVMPVMPGASPHEDHEKFTWSICFVALTIRCKFEDARDYQYRLFTNST
jgi:hypothetical protein